jgi:hypothetical protein
LLVRADLILLVGVDPSELPLVSYRRRSRSLGSVAALVRITLALTYPGISRCIDDKRLGVRPTGRRLGCGRAGSPQALIQAPAPRRPAVGRARPRGYGARTATGEVPALASWQAVAPRETLTAPAWRRRVTR